MVTHSQGPPQSARLAIVGVIVTMGVSAFSLPFSDVTTENTPKLTLDPQDSRGTQCNKGLPPPDLPFRVVWNHPDTCEKHGIPLHLDQYGIIFNRNRQFIGNEVQTLYRTGIWPTISTTGEYRHGGLPQLFNQTDYNYTREAYSRNFVPNFTGLAIIDFEAWRAIFETNSGRMKKYKLETFKLVKRRHPEYNDTMVKSEAEREWNEAAKSIMSAKLALGQKVMPGGHWGYYGYPRGWGSKSNTVLQNNKIDWLWRQSTGLFPRIYMADPNMTVSAKMTHVMTNVNEALRVQNEFSPPNTPIYPFSNLQQGTDIFFNADHLKVTLRLPADMGAGGIVLWGSSGYYKKPYSQCRRMQEHLRTVLGPFVLNLTQVMADCSDTLCGGYGRCVHNSWDEVLGKNESLRLSSLCTPRDSRYRDYHCRCYSSWQGACCHTPKPSACQQQLVPGSESSTHEQIRNNTKTSTTPDPKSMTDVLARANETSLIG